MAVLRSIVPIHGFTALVQSTGPVVSLVEGIGSMVSLVERAGPVVQDTGSVLHSVGPQILYIVLMVHVAVSVLRCTGPLQEAGGVAADQDRH